MVCLGFFFRATPYSRVFSLIALSLLVVVASLAWLLVPVRASWKVVGFSTYILSGVPVVSSIWAGKQEGIATIAIYFALVMVVESGLYAVVSPDESLARLFIVQCAVLWFVAEVALWVHSTGYWLPRLQWGSYGLPGHLLFWSPLSIVVIWGAKIGSPWTNTSRLLIFAALAQIGTGFFDLSRLTNSPWLDWLTLLLSAPFFVFLLTFPVRYYIGLLKNQ